jgi:hypothetical protein
LATGCELMESYFGRSKTRERILLNLHLGLTGIAFGCAFA